MAQVGVWLSRGDARDDGFAWALAFFGSDFGSRSRQSAGRRAHVLLPTDKAEQSRAEQNRTEQRRAEQPQSTNEWK